MVDFEITSSQHNQDTPTGKKPPTAFLVVQRKKRKGESFRTVCARIAPDFGISPKYLEQIAKWPEKYPPSPKLLRRIEKYYRQLGGTPPPPKRRRYTIEFSDDQQWLADYFKSLSMDQRLEMVEWYAEQKLSE